VLFAELGFDNKHSFSDLRHSSEYRKEWKGFITSQCRGQDVVYLLHRSLKIVFCMQDILEMPSEKNKVL
jgi:hypothetical protein